MLVTPGVFKRVKSQLSLHVFGRCVTFPKESACDMIRTYDFLDSPHFPTFDRLEFPTASC